MAPSNSPRTGQKAGLNFTGPLGGLGNNLLQRFGVKTAEREPQEQNKQQGPTIEAQGIPLPMLLWIGARLPFAAFVVILGLFTYTYHMAPIVPWVISFFAMMFAVVVCWPPKSIGAKQRVFWDWGPTFSWIFAVGFAVLFGLINYGILESWINTTFLREFKDVKANTDPDAVMDAGILSFNKDVFLDTESSAGFNYWFYTYCAAPVVHKHSPTAAPVTFWAVGVNCCNSRGGFVCDSAEDATARAAVPLRHHSIGHKITGHYMGAIKMAAAANDLEVAKEPVFVMWHKDPRAVGKLHWWFSTVMFIVLTLVALCSCCACQSGFHHISVMEKTGLD